ncbi:MAG: DUF4325 domain-containing protein [Mariniphaga sp.]
MQKVILNKVVKGAYSNSDGYTLFCILKTYFLNNEQVEISMLGFPPMSSSFFNSSFGELIHEFGIEKFRSIVKFTNITNSQVGQIRMYLDFHIH